MMKQIGRALAGLATWLAGVLPTVIRDLAGLAGAAFVAYGAWLIYEPAGFIVGGALLVAGAMLAARGSG